MRILVLISLLLFPPLGWANLALTTQSGDEINITVHLPQHGKQSNNLFIWLPSEAGPQHSEKISSQQLAQQGIEVWQVNLLEDFFLPIVASSMERLPDNAVSELIDYAIEKTNKHVYLLTTGRGAIPVLRGARHWQLQHPDSTALAGTILLSPKFFVETPDPGIKAQLMPIVTSSNLAIFILQPNKSPWFWKLGQTVPALQQGGSDVYVRYLQNVRDRFNFRPDATDYEKQLSNKLPILLTQSLKLLKPYQQKTRLAVKNKNKRPDVKVGKKDRFLKVFKGDPVPPALKLKTLSGKTTDLTQLKGKVVLVNFWATWCPPCVHEMPSMQRLQKTFKQQAFTILGVNMAEDIKTIDAFLNTKVNVSFPILLDSDGKALKNWGVFAFPTSYVVDKKGHIRYALFGGIEWDTPDIIEKITQLIEE